VWEVFGYMGALYLWEVFQSMGAPSHSWEPNVLPWEHLSHMISLAIYENTSHMGTHTHTQLIGDYNYWVRDSPPPAGGA
jgi:hypothetical protein